MRVQADTLWVNVTFSYFTDNKSDIFAWKDYPLMIQSMGSRSRLPGFKSLFLL